uniref:DNA mismatch repair proteins mutS family domain-containing protein n=1 Tax=viral metagenome TaxID=1070528 RepID=A0A6C0HCL3_9ZZZZ
MALVKEYFELTKKYQSEYGKNTVVLMQVGAFFEVYGLQDKTTGELSGSEIAEFSRVCDLNIADKKVQIGQQGVVMAGFGHYMIDKYLKRLQESGYTVVVYAQEADDVKTRTLVGIFSPGTYFSPEATHITNNTMAIWINVVDLSTSVILKKIVTKESKTNRMVQVGMANIDIYTGKSSIFEFKETYLRTPTTFDEMERFISINRPSELLIIGNIGDAEMDEILNYANVECNSVHKISLLQTLGENKSEIMKRALNSEKQIYQKELFSRFYKIADYAVFSQNFYTNSIATQAFCFLLDFIYQHNPNLVNKISEPKFENCGDRLILANHSLKQLNIINDNNDERRGKLSSVEKMLNICITSMGKRRFSYHFLNPTTDIVYLIREYNITEYLLKSFSKYDHLVGKLSQIKDIAKLNRQIIMKKISPRALFQFYKNLFIIDDIYKTVDSDNILLTYLESDSISLYCKELISFFESTMDMSLCEGVETCVQFETNFFKKNVDSGLDEKSKLLLESMDKLEAIREYFNKTIEKYEKKSTKTRTSDYVKIHETEKNHFSLLSTKRRCTLLKQSLPSLEIVVPLSYKSSFDDEECTFDFKIAKDLLEFHNQTASNDTINMPVIKELCKNVSTIKVQMKELLTQVYLKSIVAKLEEKQVQFDSIIEFVTRLDFIYAKASIAKKFNYCKPTIKESEKSFVNAAGLRHCLIEHIQQNELYVANDIQLGEAEGNIDGILLYGTNAVGKTSFIRALGIAVIMAQAGLYVPCNNFEFSPYKYIFTRILGNDDIHKGLSTFAVEMSELRTILRLADKNSLILGDELCSGTESISAKSIFVAGVQMLAAKQSSFIFATHLHEIVNYEEIVDLKTLSLKHMEVIYDKERDLLVYDRKLKDGPGDNMYGLEVCKALSLPIEFLEAAHNIRMKYQEESKPVLSLKSSHFNSKKLVSICEMCHIEMGKEVHHLQHQKDANEDGFITAEDGSSFHKNHPANLMSLCEKCHNEMHKSETGNRKKANKKVKTSMGVTVNIF